MSHKHARLIRELPDLSFIRKSTKGGILAGDAIVTGLYARDIRKRTGDTMEKTVQELEEENKALKAKLEKFTESKEALGPVEPALEVVGKYFAGEVDRAHGTLIPAIGPDELSEIVGAFQTIKEWTERAKDQLDAPPGLVFLEELTPEQEKEFLNLMTKEGILTETTMEVPMAQEEPQWCWMSPYAESAHGPFPTRMAAIQDAKKTREKETPRGDLGSVVLGRVHWPDPTKYVEADMYWLLETADEAAMGDGCWTGDEPLFEATDGRTAEKELNGLLKAWAQKHIKPNSWSIVEEEKPAPIEDAIQDEELRLLEEKADGA